MKYIESLFSLERKYKRTLTIAYDCVAILFSLYLASALLLNQPLSYLSKSDLLSVLITLITTIVCFIHYGMYRAILRYMMIPALSHIFFSVAISAMVFLLSGSILHIIIPPNTPILYAAFAIIFLGGPRIFVRNFYYHYYKRKKPNIFIYGAGSTGRDLAYALISGEEYHPVVIIDDDPEKANQIICGLRVHHSNEFPRLQNLYRPQKLLLAINNITKGKRLRLLEILSKWPIEVQSVPSMEDIAVGKASVTEVRDLDIADLLGRAPIDPNPRLLKKNISDKHVMITGAGGSIGAELCRQILSQQPNVMVLFELNEFNLYCIDQELKWIKKRGQYKTRIITALGSVQKKHRMQQLMTDHHIETIYHAAAYKHVPLVEDNIIEGIRNNVFGTLATAEAAIQAGVKHFTLISTDKAVRPTNIMGASKRLAELTLQALADKQNATIFTMVRFGNVLDSSGSVVPLFRRQIRQGGPVTVTHPDIIRYFMLIPEAAQLVIQAGALANNGQVFVLDMGEPIKIYDLAQRMIRLMGMVPYTKNTFVSNTENTRHDGDIEIQFTGLRPGEKLYEELLIGSNVEGTQHTKIMTATEEKLSWQSMSALLQELDYYCHQFNTQAVMEIIMKAPTGYHQE